MSWREVYGGQRSISFELTLVCVSKYFFLRTLAAIWQLLSVRQVYFLPLAATSFQQVSYLGGHH